MRCSRRETSASKLCVLAASLVGVWASAVKGSLLKNVGRGIPAETARRSGYRGADASMQARNQALAGKITRAVCILVDSAPGLRPAPSCGGGQGWGVARTVEIGLLRRFFCD